MKLQKSNFAVGQEDNSERESTMDVHGEIKPKKRIAIPGQKSFTPPSGLTPVSSEDEQEVI